VFPVVSPGASFRYPIQANFTHGKGLYGPHDATRLGRPLDATDRSFEFGRIGVIWNRDLNFDVIGC